MFPTRNDEPSSYDCPVKAIMFSHSMTSAVAGGSRMTSNAPGSRSSMRSSASVALSVASSPRALMSTSPRLIAVA